MPENADARRLPGPGELRILTVLWENGPSTVREVYEAVSDETGWGYTTALKMLQLMHEKRLVIRDTSNTAHTYAAAASAARTRRALVDDLLHRGFGGSVVELVRSVLQAAKPSPSEKAKLRGLLQKRN